jgi:hypothetical protein
VCRNQVKEAGLPFGIAHPLDTGDGIVGDHRSRISLIMWWSYSIRAIRLARSEADA